MNKVGATPNQPAPDAEEFGVVDKASQESFPAADPPSWFGGKRIAMRNVFSGVIYYYAEDMLGSSRTERGLPGRRLMGPPESPARGARGIVESGGSVQAGQMTPWGVYPERSRRNGDFYPGVYPERSRRGGERIITNTCSQNYKFEGKERDTENGNDDFGARYYSSRLGRWLSADWSSVPVPVPYANLSNPQTLNLYAMVSDNPETFADLDGHCGQVVVAGAPTASVSVPCDGNPNSPANAAQAGNSAQQTGTGVGQSDAKKAATPPPAPPAQSGINPNYKIPTFDLILKKASDFSAGAGDALTGRMIPGVHTSLTEYLRGKADSVVSKNSASYGLGGFTGSTVGYTLIGAAAGTGAAALNGKYGSLFGRGGAVSGGLFNRGFVRFGWYWNGVRDAIGLRIGPAGTFHIPFWHP